MKPKAYAQTVEKWLIENLGKGCLGVCTGHDVRALRAAVQIADLWGGADQYEQITAAAGFGLVVLSMQREARELAYHAIAHPLDWSHRSQLWRQAGLPPFCARLCAYEPGGKPPAPKEARRLNPS